MGMTNTLAYYATATFRAVKSFIVALMVEIQSLGIHKLGFRHLVQGPRL
jgi:hypothetical protein